MSSTEELAALTGDLAALKAAIDADPEAVVVRHGPARLTLLMLASVRGHVEAVSLLLQAGADPNAVNANGETALMLAASAGRPDVVRVLIGAGARVDAWDRFGMTALHRAAWGYTQCRRMSATVRALLDAGADASIPDRHGTLPHQTARRRMWSWTVPLLRWEFCGYYPAGRKDPVVRMLEEAVSHRP